MASTSDEAMEGSRLSSVNVSSYLFVKNTFYTNEYDKLKKLKCLQYKGCPRPLVPPNYFKKFEKITITRKHVSDSSNISKTPPNPYSMLRVRRFCYFLIFFEIIGWYG